MGAYRDRSGEKLFNFTLLYRISVRPTKYQCRCMCGDEREYFLSNISSQKTKNCIICQAKNRSSHLIGEKIDHLLVLDSQKVNNKIMYLVQCDCGTKRFMYAHRLGPTKTHIKTCGRCYLRSKKRDHTNYTIGTTHGMVKIIGIGNKSSNVLCLCKCGNQKIICKQSLRLNPNISCGCFYKENHPNKGEGNGKSRFTEIEILSALELIKTKQYSKDDICKMLGMSDAHLYNIINGYDWKYLKKKRDKLKI